MKKIYIVLTRTNSQFGRLIRRYTGHEYNHASISLDQELETVFSFGRKNLMNPFSGGFVHEEMRNNPFFKNSVTAILSLEVTKEQYNLLQRRIMLMFADKENYRYSITGVMSVVFSKKLTYSDKNYICSTFVADMLEKIEIDILAKPVYLVKPYDFIESEGFTIEYQGLLEEYLAYA